MWGAIQSTRSSGLVQHLSSGPHVTQPAARPEQPRGLGPELGLAILTVIWGVNFAVIKVALEAIEPLAFNALRFPVAALVLWAFMRSEGAIRVPRRADLPQVVLLGVLGNILYQLLFIVGIDRTLAGNASLMLATTPVWTLVIASVLGVERHGLLVWTGVLATVVGMVLIVIGGADAVGASPESRSGDVLLALAAITWSAYTVMGQSLTRRYGSLAVTGWTLWIGTVGLVVMGLPALSRTDFEALGPGVWAAVLYAGVLAIAVAYLLWYRAVERIGASRTAAFSNLIPVVALVTAWLWLGERPTPLQLLGAAVVIGGVTLARSAREADAAGDVAAHEGRDTSATHH